MISCRNRLTKSPRSRHWAWSRFRSWSRRRIWKSAGTNSCSRCKKSSSTVVILLLDLTNHSAAVPTSMLLMVGMIVAAIVAHFQLTRLTVKYWCTCSSKAQTILVLALHTGEPSLRATVKFISVVASAIFLIISCCADIIANMFCKSSAFDGPLIASTNFAQLFAVKSGSSRLRGLRVGLRTNKWYQMWCLGCNVLMEITKVIALGP